MTKYLSLDQERLPKGQCPHRKICGGQRSINKLLKWAPKYMEYVKEDRIFVYSCTLAAIEPKIISLVAMDTRSGKLDKRQ